MQRRQSNASLVANPILVGAVTVLVVAVAVFLSYNANNGLPFVPTYDIDIVVPDAAQVVAGNDVRIGGSRVGVVKKVEAEASPDGRGRPAARLSLALEEAARPLPVDTRATIRLRSNLGLKYVELRPGDERRMLSDGGTLGLRQSTGVTDFDDAISVFDEDTRSALRSVVRDMGEGVAGRGPSINRAVEELPETAADLGTVAATLRAGETNLQGFLRGAQSATAAIAPVSEPLGSLMAAGARTFEALDAERDALDATIRLAPSLERAGVTGFRSARLLAREATGLLRDARPAVRILTPTANRLTAGLRASGPVLGRARPLATDLEKVLGDLTTLSRRPSTTPSLERLTSVAGSTDHLLQVVTPFQTKCNYLGVWGRNVASTLSEGDRYGAWLRFIPIANTAEMLQSSRPAPDLHRLTDIDTGAGGECEAGNETFLPGQHIGGAPGVQPLETERTAPTREDVG